MLPIRLLCRQRCSNSLSFCEEAESKMEQIRWGLIGAGDIVRKRVAPALTDLPGCAVYAVSRGQTDKAQAFADEFGIPNWYGSWKDLLADSAIDAVYIATPHNQHADQAVAAAEAGKHVLCEKPMAVTGSDCRRMIDACRKSKVKLCVAYYRHFYPVINRIKEILSSGQLGKAILVQINSFTRYDLKPEDPRYWMIVKSQSGGGPVMAGGCHRIEVFLNLFGKVIDTTGVLENVLVQREVEDTAVVILRFESGPLCVLSMSQSINESRDTLYIYGSEGSVHVPVLNRGEMTIHDAEGTKNEAHPCHSNSHLPLIEDFVAAIRDNREPGVNGGIGLAVQEVEDAVYGT